MDIEIEHEVRQMRTIAALYTKRSKFSEAESVYRSLLLIQEKHLGECSAELAITCHQLAEVYCDMGQYGCAKPFFARAVTIWGNLNKLELIKPEETIFFMDALIGLQRTCKSEILHDRQEETSELEQSRSAA